MKEEVLNKKMSKENPFRVPEGYFESFSERIMQQLPSAPETETTEKPLQTPVETSYDTVRPVNLFTRIKPYLYLAAMFAGLYFGIYVFKYQASMHNSSARQETEHQTAIVTSDEYIDEMFNFAMVDKEMIYECISEDY